MNKKGFTYVELLVTITIVVILTTIGFVAFNGFSGTSRDAVRKSDGEKIEKALNLFNSSYNRFPETSSGVNITYSGSNLWNQGEFGLSTIRTVGKVHGSLKDPKFGNYYTYSVTENRREYQLGIVLESDENYSAFLPKLVETSYADSPITMIKGNYNNIFLHTKSGSLTFLLASPSIISTDLSNTSFLSINSGRKFAYNKYSGSPHTYRNSNIYTSNGINFIIPNPLVYSGSTQDLGKYAGIKLVNNGLRSIYSGSILRTNLNGFLSSTGTTYIKTILSDIVGINPIQPYYCNEILEAGLSVGDGYYTVDSDGSGKKGNYEVYCDMTTGGGGWTRVGENHLRNADFSLGFHIENWTEDIYNREHTVEPIQSPIESGYALNQHSVAGYNTSNNYGDIRYLISPSDISVFKKDYEIRISAWIADAWDQGNNTNGGLGYVFANTLTYTDNTTRTNGVLETLSTQVVGGKTWRLQRVRIPIAKNPSAFIWEAGRGAETGLSKNFFMTDMKIELFYK